MTCRSCGWAVPPGAKFCNGCGAVVPGPHAYASARLRAGWASVLLGVVTARQDAAATATAGAAP
jgi:zinc-ribbon domain